MGMSDEERGEEDRLHRERREQERRERARKLRSLLVMAATAYERMFELELAAETADDRNEVPAFRWDEYSFCVEVSNVEALGIEFSHEAGAASCCLAPDDPPDVVRESVDRIVAAAEKANPW